MPFQAGLMVSRDSKDLDKQELSLQKILVKSPRTWGLNIMDSRTNYFIEAGKEKENNKTIIN